MAGISQLLFEVLRHYRDISWQSSVSRITRR